MLWKLQFALHHYTTLHYTICGSEAFKRDCPTLKFFFLFKRKCFTKFHTLKVVTAEVLTCLNSHPWDSRLKSLIFYLKFFDPLENSTYYTIHVVIYFSALLLKKITRYRIGRGLFIYLRLDAAKLSEHDPEHWAWK